MELTSFDKKLLNVLQKNLPVCSRPFAKIAEQLDTDEEFVLKKIRELKSAGFLRRIGTFFDSNSLGYSGTLVAMKVLPEEIKSVAEFVNKFPGATHNYEREGNFNLWFTLLTPSTECEKKILSEIKSVRGVQDMVNLKANKKYKINVQFNLK